MQKALPRLYHSPSTAPGLRRWSQGDTSCDTYMQLLDRDDSMPTLTLHLELVADALCVVGDCTGSRAGAVGRKPRGLSPSVRFCSLPGQCAPLCRAALSYSPPGQYCPLAPPHMFTPALNLASSHPRPPFLYPPCAPNTPALAPRDLPLSCAPPLLMPDLPPNQPLSCSPPHPYPVPLLTPRSSFLIFLIFPLHHLSSLLHLPLQGLWYAWIKSSQICMIVRQPSCSPSLCFLLACCMLADCFCLNPQYCCC